MIKIRREKTKISKIRNEKREIITNTKEVHEIISDYFKKLYYNKLENLKEMDKFLHPYDHPELNQKDIDHLTRYIICNETEAAIKGLQKKKSTGPDGFSDEFY
jgi:hypothetical protein